MVIEISNPIRFVAILIIPFILFGIAFYLKSKDVENWVVRKYIHTVGLFVAGVIGAFLPSLSELLTIVGIITIILLILSIPPIELLQRLTSIGTRKGESQFLLFMNGFSTSAGVILLIILFFDIKWIFLSSVLCVAIGDGLGEFIGRPYGKHKYTILGTKSIEGSLGVLFGSFIGGLGSILIFGVFSTEFLLVIILASVVVTLIEAVSVIFIDNLVMPMAYAGILWFLLV